MKSLLYILGTMSLVWARHGPSVHRRHHHQRINKRQQQSFSNALAYMGPEGSATACGPTYTNSDLVVGVGPALYGSNQVSPLCGTQVNIINRANNKSVTATVQDLCSGCSADGALYVSLGVFDSVDDYATNPNGYIIIDWEFVDASTTSALSSSSQDAPTTQDVFTTIQATTATFSEVWTASPTAQVVSTTGQDWTPTTTAEAVTATASPVGSPTNSWTSQATATASPVGTPQAAPVQPVVQAAANVAANVSTSSSASGGSSSGGGAQSANGWTAASSWYGSDMQNQFTADTSTPCQGPCVNWGMGPLTGVDSNGAFYVTQQTGNVNGQNRGTMRLVSNKMFSPGTLFIADIAEMPANCGDWPALWLTSGTEQWPAGGEIDWIEYANLYTQNTFSLHTGGSSSCNTGAQSGPSTLNVDGGSSTTCNVNDSGDGGCAFISGKPNSVGPNFNQNGGGVFALVWSYSSGIQNYFFPRGQVPQDILSNAPNPSSWSSALDFSIDAGSCSPSDFVNLQLIIDNQMGGQFSSGTFNNQAAGDQTGNCGSMFNTDAQSLVTGSGGNLGQSMWKFNSILIWTQ